MSDYRLDKLRETFGSIMRKGTSSEGEDVIHALARYLGFVRVTDTMRQPIESAITSAIRHGLLGDSTSMTSIVRMGDSIVRRLIHRPRRPP
jgi:hypothetical protein